MPHSLLPERFLYRFSVPCFHREKLWSAKGAQLGPKYSLASFAELEGISTPVDVRTAWNEGGLIVAAQVSGKKQPPWCRLSRLEDSDGFQLWIDTRNVQNVHRATRFCHRFLFLPTGGGSSQDRPVAQWLPINRAAAQPQAIESGSLKVRSEPQSDGYLIEAFLASEALTGFDPAEHPRLGFTFALVDRELGEHAFTVGSPMPYKEDPSLWATLELVHRQGPAKK